MIACPTFRKYPQFAEVIKEGDDHILKSYDDKENDRRTVLTFGDVVKQFSTPILAISSRFVRGSRQTAREFHCLAVSAGVLLDCHCVSVPSSSFVFLPDCASLITDVYDLTGVLLTEIIIKLLVSIWHYGEDDFRSFTGHEKVKEVKLEAVVKHGQEE